MTSPLPVHAPIHAPVAHAQKLHHLLSQVALRSFHNHLSMACMLPMRTDVQTWEELLSMQAAVWKRLQQQQTDWVTGCHELVQDYAQLKQANTLSKFVEQEYNAIAQLGALISAQVASLGGLMENLQVDLGYWVAQKQTETQAD